MNNNEIVFSPWVNWASRNGLAGARDTDFGGLYLFARFDQQVPPGPADPFDRSVVYIGQSSKQTFRSRWDPFDRAVNDPTKAKYRAKRYTQLFGPSPSFPHVAALPYQDLVRAFMGIVPCSFLDLDANRATVGTDIMTEFLDKSDDLLTKYIERRLILLHALRNGHRPALNVD
jgi:hypothetical protein